MNRVFLHSKKYRVLNAGLVIILLLTSFPVNAQIEEKPEVMVLGTFHFGYQNLDLIKVDPKDQIDVMSARRQVEVNDIVRRLAAFKPTIIAIENKTWEQQNIDEQYRLYLKDSLKLPKQEQYQIAFRLAKKLNHSRIHCIDTWGNIDYFAAQVSGANNFTERPERAEQLKAIGAAQQTEAEERKSTTATNPTAYQTLGEILYKMNLPQSLKGDHEHYFRAVFESEVERFDYTGVDWVALSWYSRNLRIFRNLLRLQAKPDDRVFVLYGSGHAYLLNQFIEESGRFRIVSPLPYLN